MTIRVLIVDDEAVARRRITRLLANRKDVQVVGESSGGREAVNAVRELEPHVVFLDVQMPDMDGFEVLEELDGEHLPAVVFVTAYDQYALRAFDACAIDYVMKPYEPERLEQALSRALHWIRSDHRDENDDRIRRLLQEVLQGSDGGGPARDKVASDVERSTPGSASARYLDRFQVKRGNKTQFVRVVDVDWIESDGNYLRLHVAQASHLVRGTITDCVERLDPRKFVRVHRRFVINMDRVAEIQPWFGGDYVLQLTTGAKLRLSRTYREEFQERMLGG